MYDRAAAGIDDEWSDEETPAADAGDAEEDDPRSQVPTFPALYTSVRAAIERLDGAVVPKLNWSSPKVMSPSPVPSAFSSQHPSYAAPRLSHAPGVCCSLFDAPPPRRTPSGSIAISRSSAAALTTSFSCSSPRRTSFTTSPTPTKAAGAFALSIDSPPTPGLVCVWRQQDLE